MCVLIGCITLDIFNVVNLRATLEIGAHSNHVEFHVNVYTFRSNVVVHQEVGNYVLFVPVTPHTIHIGHASHHHDRCCVGSDRLSDSVAEKPISASSDSRVYQRCLCTTSPSPKLILRERCLRWMKLILRMKLIRWKNILVLTVGISSVPNVLRKKLCSCVRSSSCTRSSCSASTT